MQLTFVHEELREIIKKYLIVFTILVQNNSFINTLQS